MIRFALKSLAGRKLRTSLTALAIVLGVAMMSGAYVLTDTIDKAFDAIFVDSYAGTDAVVTGKDRRLQLRGRVGRGAADPGGDARARPGGRRRRGRHRLGSGLPDEAAAAGRRGDRHRRRAVVRVRHRDGARVRPLQPAQPRRGPLAQRRRRGRRRRGRRRRRGPEARRPDRRRGARAGAGVRDRRHRQVRRPELDRRRHVRDLRRADGAEAAGQGRAARRGAGRGGGRHHARAADAANPVGARRATSRSERASSRRTRQSSEIATFTTIIRYFLLSFAGIALFVGAFVIFNTLSITVAQRMREFATLRTLGASRRQVLRSVILEALVIGLGASIVGLFGGLGLAVGLNELFKALNLDLPQTETVFATRTIVVSLLVGTLVTLVAGLFPAIRATRVPPIAAVREGATMPRGRFARFTPYIAAVIVALAVLALGYGTLADDIAHRRPVRAARRRRPRAVHRGRDALVAARASARAGRGHPGPAHGRRGRQARRGQRAAQSGPHGRDRGGADDRDRARDVRLRARQRPARLEQRRDRAPDPVRPDRHVAGRLLRVPGRRRRRRRRTPRASRR